MVSRWVWRGETLIVSFIILILFNWVMAVTWSAPRARSRASRMGFSVSVVKINGIHFILFLTITFPFLLAYFRAHLSFYYTLIISNLQKASYTHVHRFLQERHGRRKPYQFAKWAHHRKPWKPLLKDISIQQQQQQQQ